MIKLLDGTTINISKYTDITNYSGQAGTGLSSDPSEVHEDVLSWFSHNDYGVFWNSETGLRTLIYKHSIAYMQFG